MRCAVTLRPIQEDDLPFLSALYAGTREDELSVVPWTEEQKRAFLQFQFDAQHRHYQTHYPGARYDVIEAEGVPIGRLYVDRRCGEIGIIDIALLPAHQRRGIGGELLRDLLTEAQQRGDVVLIHVEQNNSARRLYERLGFRKIGDTGIYDLLKWSPVAGTSQCAQRIPDEVDGSLEAVIGRLDQDAAGADDPCPP